MKKATLITAALFLAAIAAPFYPVTYRVGVDGTVSEKKVPLYAKACAFLYRDWSYRALAREISDGRSGQTKTALAVLKWTHDNVKPYIPDGFRTVDDHPLNIVIRQYGAPDQIADIFTILCSYSGMEARWERCFSHDRSKAVIWSLVKADGRWLVFDVAQNRYFTNKRDAIADVSDCAANDIVLSASDAAVYGDCFVALGNVRLYQERTERQKPLPRLLYELKRLISKR